MAKDKELADHERAHSGQPGAKVRHGADATGHPGKPRLTKAQQDDVMKDRGSDSIGGVLNRAAARAGKAHLGTGVEYTKPEYKSIYTGVVPPNRGHQPLNNHGKAFMESDAASKRGGYDPKKAQQD